MKFYVYRVSSLIDRVIISKFRLVEPTLCTMHDVYMKYRRSFSEIRYLPSAARYSATENITALFPRQYVLSRSCYVYSAFWHDPEGQLNAHISLRKAREQRDFSFAEFLNELATVRVVASTPCCRNFNVVARIIENNKIFSLSLSLCVCKFLTDLRQRNNTTRTRSSTSIHP